MENYFNDLAAAADRALRAGESYTIGFAAEETDFVRMNRGKVRQSGHVAQRYVDLRLIRGARHASHRLSLGGESAADARAIGAALDGLRDALTELPEDPHLLLPDTVASSRHEHGESMPATEAMVDTLLALARGQDLVGMLAAGPVYRGFANARAMFEPTTSMIKAMSMPRMTSVCT